MQKINEFFKLKITFIKAIALLSAMSLYFHFTGQTVYAPGLTAGITGLILIHLFEPILNKLFNKIDKKESEKEVL